MKLPVISASGVGSVLIPLSSLVTSGSTALAPGVEAALKTWAAGQHQPRTTPDVAPAPGAAVAAAAATAPAAASLATLVPHLPQVLPAVASKTAHRLALLEAQRVAPNSPDVSLAASVTRAWTGEIRAGAGAAPSSPDQGLQQRPLQATSLLVDPVRQATSLAGLGNSLQEPAGAISVEPSRKCFLQFQSLIVRCADVTCTVHCSDWAVGAQSCSLLVRECAQWNNTFRQCIEVQFPGFGCSKTGEPPFAVLLADGS